MAIVCYSVHFRQKENLKNIMYTCIILYSVIVEDEGDTITNSDDDEDEALILFSQGCTQNFQHTRE